MDSLKDRDKAEVIIEAKSWEVEINIKPERMAFLKFIIEGFGHLALPVTLSAKAGKIKLLVSPPEKDRWKAIQKDLQNLF